MPNPNPAAAQTDGKFVAAAIQISGTNVVANQTVAANKPNAGNYSLTMSLTSANGFAATTQLTPKIVDAINVTNPTSFALTSVAAAVAGVAVYTGTITGGGSNAFAGFEFTVAGLVASSGINNGTFLCTASTATTLTLTNAAAVVETAAGTAKSFVGTVKYYSYGDPANKAGSAPAWYLPSNFSGYDPNVASVSSSGLITARALGQTVIEISFPVFDNTLGNSPQAQLEPINFIYTQVVVTVTP
jgi:hypothetical protein